MMGEIMQLPATQNVYINSTLPDNNFSHLDYMWLGSQLEDMYAILMQFDLETIPVGSNIYSALVYGYVMYSSSSSEELKCAFYPVTKSWDEDLVTWNDAKGHYDSSALSENVKIGDTGWYIWDVTDIVRDWYRGEKRNQGMILVPSSEIRNYKKLARTNYKDLELAPKLKVQYYEVENDKDVCIAKRGTCLPLQGVEAATTDEYQELQSVDVLGQTDVTIFVQNIGSEPALVKLQMSPDDKSYIDESQSQEVAQGKMIFIIPGVFANYYRICYKSKNKDNATKLKFFCQMRV